MGEIKEFPNNSFKVYYEIAKGEEDVQLDNFNQTYELLPDLDIFEEKRIGIGKELLGALRFVEPQFTFYRKDESAFLEAPQDFSMRMIPGSDLEKSLSKYKEIQFEINELFGHYSVCLKLVNFLIMRNAQLVKKNNKIIEKYTDLSITIDQLTRDKEVSNLKVQNLDEIKIKNDLLLTKEEKVLPVKVVEEPEVVESDEKEVVDEEEA